MNTNRMMAGLMIAAMVAAVAPVQAQSLQDRIKNVRKQQQREVAVAQFKAAQTMAKVLPTVNREQVTAKEAFEWLQVASGVTIVVNWRSMEVLGIDQHSPVNLITQGLTFGKALEVVTEQLSADAELIVEPTPWYVEIMTKEVANRRAVTLVYPIGDLLHEIPQFTEAPEFDLTAVTQSGGGGGGGGQSLFQEASTDEPAMTKREHAEAIATLIRETIEPDLWRQNGGLAGSIAVYKESLVIRAPAYVHRQIGGVSPTPTGAGPAAAGLGAVPAQNVAPRRNPNAGPALLVAKPAANGKANAVTRVNAQGAVNAAADPNTNTRINATNTVIPVSIVKPDADTKTDTKPDTKSKSESKSKSDKR